MKTASFVLFAMFVLSCQAPLHAAEQRPWRITDQFALDVLRSPVFSPDGRAVAFIRQRAKNSVPAHMQNVLGLHYQSRQDIWLQSAPGQKPVNLTNGKTDNSGWWGPQWSPDGERLAFFSTRGGNVTLWVWEKGTSKLRQLCRQGVDFDVIILTGGTYSVTSNFRWLDNNRILFLAPAEGEISRSLTMEGKTVERATAAWEKARRGDLTVTVADSLEFPQPRARLFVVDAASGKTQLLVDTSRPPRVVPWTLSPTNQMLGFVRPGSTHYGVGSSLRMGSPFSMELLYIDGQKDGQKPQLNKPLPNNVLMATVSWSPDGKELAFFANGDEPINPLNLFGSASVEVMPEYVKNPKRPVKNPAKLYRVKVGDSVTVEVAGTGDIDLGYLGAPIFMWTAAGEMVFHAPRNTTDAKINNIPRNAAFRGQGDIGPEANEEWLVLERSGRTRPLTSEIKKLPKSLQSIERGAAFVGLSEGEVWRIDAASGAARNLTEKVPRVYRIESIDTHAMKLESFLVVAEAEGAKASDAEKRYLEGGYAGLAAPGTHGYYVVDALSGESRMLKPPSPTATVSAFSPQSKSVIYSVADRNGTALWREALRRESGTGAGLEKLAETNTFLQEILMNETRKIEFTSLNGQKLEALIVLPDGYKPGRRVPLIAYIYPGQGISAWISAYSPTSANWFELGQSAGYAILIPDLPNNLPGMKEEEGQYSIPMLVNAVVPAVEKAVELGIADGERLFVTGGSAGGWATAGLLTQTTRFKAGISSAGLYKDGRIFSPAAGALGSGIHRRYDEYSVQDWTTTTGFNKSYYPTDVPWWRDMERIRRQDPFSYIDRIQTPLMLVHADLDSACNIEDAEGFYRALVSMRKPAQLVRYWGEGHVLQVPANVVDMHSRYLAWFDQWGDIARDTEGRIVYDEKGSVKSRNGAPALKPEDFARFDFFGPGGEEGNVHWNNQKR